MNTTANAPEHIETLRQMIEGGEYDHQNDDGAQVFPRERAAIKAAIAALRRQGAGEVPSPLGDWHETAIAPTQPPGVDRLAALAGKWRADANSASMRRCIESDGYADGKRDSADELDAYIREQRSNG